MNFGHVKRLTEKSAGIEALYLLYITRNKLGVIDIKENRIGI